ncbi:MAG: SsrA-binding protein SmpB [Alphaproteobacteria bacterium]
MNKKATKPQHYISHGRVTENRRARFDYEILSHLTAGMVLKGSEVKALRLGRCNLSDSYAGLKNGEIYLFNASISGFDMARQKHEEKAHRKLLLTKQEQKRLIGAVKRDGLTLVPLEIFFSARGFAKVKLALAKGKGEIDKRETIKAREWKKQQGRALRRKS